MIDLERAARAICYSIEGMYCFGECQAARECLGAPAEVYIDSARAALEAPRKPSEEAIEAMARALALFDYGQDVWDRMVETNADLDNLRMREDVPTSSRQWFRNNARAAHAALFDHLLGGKK